MFCGLATGIPGQSSVTMDPAISNSELVPATANAGSVSVVTAEAVSSVTGSALLSNTAASATCSTLQLSEPHLQSVWLQRMVLY